MGRLTLAAATVVAAASVGAATAATTPSAVVRAWSAAVSANNNAAAARLFAPGAQVNGRVLRSSAQALAFNAALPCGWRVTSTAAAGNRVTATFLLAARPGHRCGAAGGKTTWIFTVRGGKIVGMRQGRPPAPQKTTGVTVSPNGPYLLRNGAPFLIMGDSGGSMINITVPQARAYFADRQKRGFNLVLIHILCAQYTACRSDGTTIDGIKPFTSGTSPSSFDLATPNPAYWQRIDAFVDLANQHGMVALLDVLETGSFLTTLQSNGAAKAFAYGVFVGNRYKNN